MLINTQTQNIQTPKSPAFKGRIGTEDTMGVLPETPLNQDVSTIKNFIELIEGCKILPPISPLKYEADVDLEKGEYVFRIMDTEKDESLFAVTLTNSEPADKNSPEALLQGEVIKYKTGIDETKELKIPSERSKNNCLIQFHTEDGTHIIHSIRIEDLPQNLQDQINTSVKPILWEIANPREVSLLTNLRRGMKKFSERIAEIRR